MAMVMVAPAQAAPPPGSRSATPQPRFDIPAQSLADALDRFARQAGVQILYPYARAAALRSPLVKGRMPSRRALDRLLRGSGLTYQQRNGSYVIVAAPRGDGPKGVETARAAAEPAAALGRADAPARLPARAGKTSLTIQP
jgi:hypothetical protein